MVGRLSPYPGYRDSGLPWLRIPAHWEVRRNGRLFAQRNETGHPDLPILEVSLRTGVRVRDLDNSKRKQVMEDRSKYKRAAEGDIAYNMMRMWQGAVGATPTAGLVSPAYVVAAPFPEAESRYYSYLFRTPTYMREVNKFSRGIVTDRNRLYWDEFKQMPSVFPPTEEQTAIADFLDAHGRLARRFIRNKRRLISLLKEQKQAIINAAITRGLDPCSRMKRTGIEWLPDIPQDWELRRLKQVCRFVYGDSLPDERRMPGSVQVFGSNGPVGTHNQANTLAPCIVIGRKGSFGKVNCSKHALFAIDTTYFVDQRFTPAVLRWLYFLLIWARLDEVTKDAAIPGLDREDAYAALIPWCSPREQASISKYIDHEFERVDAAILKVEREINLMAEYRGRLIDDVVIGKLDVRNAKIAAVAEDLDAGEIEGTEDEGPELADEAETTEAED